MNKSKSRDYLKSMLNGGVPVDLSAALECFRQYYRASASVYRPDLQAELEAAASKHAAESEVEEDDSGDVWKTLGDILSYI